MIRLIGRCWKYLVAVTNDIVESRIDSRLQVEMAVEEARRQHQVLTAQAASVLGNERELGVKATRALADVERAREAAGRALLLASRARGEGRADDAADYERTATLFATHLAAAETLAAELTDAKHQASAASAAARRALERSAYLLNCKVAEASRLMTHIEAARMQERVADALTALDRLAPKSAVPTLDEVRSRVDHRISRAAARAELADSGAAVRMLEIERAGLDEVAAQKLTEIRQRLGLPAATMSD